MRTASPRQFHKTLSRILLSGALLTAFSCSREDTKQITGEPESTGIVKEYPRGPATGRLKLDRTELSIAEKLQLSIEIEADESYRVELPKFGDKLEQFGIIDYRTERPRLIGTDRILTSKSYVLEPFLSGEYTIPAMELKFWKKTENKEEIKRHTIETEAITITVDSLLPEDLEELKIADIASPLELPRNPAYPLWTALAGIGLALIIVGILVRYWRKRKGGNSAPKQIPAHRIAYAELEKLVGENLIEQAKVQLFYQKISSILRYYIENRFGLHAPERTTEEFLQELGTEPPLKQSGSLAKDHRDLLSAFLTHCDMVKFAEHQPSNSEIQKTFDSCKNFISQTQEPV